MKTFLAAIVLLLAPAAGHAMMYLDYRVVSFEEMSSMGVQILAFSAGDRTTVTVHVRPTDKKWIVRGVSFAVLDTPPGPEVSSSTRKNGEVADPTKWGEQVRGENSETGKLKFSVSESERLRSFIVVVVTLPNEAGVPCDGGYYFLLRELPKG